MKKTQNINPKISKLALLTTIIVGGSIIVPISPTLAHSNEISEGEIEIALDPNDIFDILAPRYRDGRYRDGRRCRTLPFHHKLRGKVSRQRLRRWRDHGHRRCIKHRGDDRYHRHDRRGWIPYRNWQERYFDRDRYWGDENDWRDDWRNDNDWKYWRNRNRRDRRDDRRDRRDDWKDDWKDRRDDWKDRRDDWKDRRDDRRRRNWDD